MEIGYYPGCALHGSSNDYETSVRACLGKLGVGLRELDDWICCGATAAHSLNHKLAVALPARNLALAKRDGMTELLAPCPMCSMELLRANRALAACPRLQKEISEIVELEVDGSTQVLNFIQVVQKIGLEAIARQVVRPLNDFRPACYYGCLLDASAAGRAVRRLRAAQQHGNALGGPGRGAGRLELQDRVLRRRHDAGRRRDRAGPFAQDPQRRRGP